MPLKRLLDFVLIDVLSPVSDGAIITILLLLSNKTQSFDHLLQLLLNKIRESNL